MRAVGRQEQIAVGTGRQQIAEHDPHRAVLRCRDDRAEPLRRRHAGVGAAACRWPSRSSLYSGTFWPGVVRCRELDVAAHQGGRQVRAEPGAVLHQADDVLVGLLAAVGLRLRHGQRHELVGGGRVGALRDVRAAGAGDAGVAGHGEGVLELLDALRQVAVARRVDRDARDRTHVGGDGGRRTGAGPCRVGDVHDRGRGVAGAGVGDREADELQGGAGLGWRVAGDRIVRRAVVDVDGRRGCVAGARPVDGDLRDHAAGAQVRRLHVARGDGAVGVVGQVEAHGRHGVSGAAVGERDRVDATRGRHRRAGPSATGDVDLELGVARAALVDRRGDDAAGGRDGRGRGGRGAGGALYGNGGVGCVVVARGGDVDLGDAARARVDLGDRRSALAGAGDLHVRCGHGQGTVRPVGTGPEVVRDLGLVSRRCRGARRGGRWCRQRHCRVGREPRQDQRRRPQQRRDRALVPLVSHDYCLPPFRRALGDNVREPPWHPGGEWTTDRSHD